MRQRPVTVFFAGFVFGLVFLAVLLRQTGMLRTIDASVAPARSREFQTQPAQRPDMHRSRLSATPVDPPPAEVPNTAFRIPLEQQLMARRLIIPVQGVHAEDLRDAFNEMRGGHRHEAIDIM